jgi:hypothetical protein
MDRGFRPELIWLVALLLSGCAYVPPLVDDPITITEIVQRIKCEIWDATPVPRGKYPTGPYQWMRDWTAKVDLTLQTDDAGGVNPGVSLINPMRSVTLPGAGTFPQMFSLGLGGGLNTTASRIETLSFTLSFAELRNPAYLGMCTPPKGLGLLGNLGLKEWMRDALAPASGPNPELFIGYHAAPASAAKAAPKPPAKAEKKIEKLDEIQQKINELNDTVRSVEWYASEAASYASSAQRLANNLRNVDLTKPPQEFYREIQQSADYIAMTNDAVVQANKQIKLANEQVTELKKIEDTDSRIKPALTTAQQTIDKANEKMKTATKDANAAQTKFPSNPPIDSIAHQVSFVVTLAASITPSWTLVRFKGPGAGTSSTFAAASRAFTHTLNISMGSPSNSGMANVSAEQIRQLDYLHQDSAFRNALILQTTVLGAPF